LNAIDGGINDGQPILMVERVPCGVAPLVAPLNVAEKVRLFMVLRRQLKILRVNYISLQIIS
jgi:hypothetical protein